MSLLPDTQITEKEKSLVCELSAGKKIFFEALEPYIVKVHNDEYMRRRQHPGNLARFMVKSFEMMGESKVRINDLEILENIDGFHYEGEEYSDIAEFVELHEKEELWQLVNSKYWRKDKIDLLEKKQEQVAAHRMALEEQYREAFRKGKAERMLSFFCRTAIPHRGEYWGAEIIAENQEVFNMIKLERDSLGK